MWRRVRSSVVAGLSGSLIVLSVAAAPAQAKSGIAITAVALGSPPGSIGRVAVSAFGGDDAAGRQRLCVQRLAGHTWHTAVCGRIQLGTGGWVNTMVGRSVHGTSWFRAALERIDRDGRPQPIADLVSAPVGIPAASAAASAGPAMWPAMGSATEPAMAASAGPATAAFAGPAMAASADVSGADPADPAGSVVAGSAASPANEAYTTSAEPDSGARGWCYWGGWGGCAQPQTDSKSTVSLSSVDSGISTASVVRSK